MNKTRINTTFKEREAAFAKQADFYMGEVKAFSRAYNQMALLRAVWFLLSISVLVYLANKQLASLFLPSFVVFVGIFLLLLRKHLQIKKQRQNAEYLGGLNRNELLRLRLKLGDLPNGGEGYLSATHPYAADLDLFGEHSLFKLLNRSATRGGEQYLAKMMLSTTIAAEAKKRQHAVAELTDKQEWRQLFQSMGRASKEGPQVAEITAWASSAPPKSGVWLRLVAFAAAVSAVVVGLLVVVGTLHINWLIPALSANLLVSVFYGKVISAESEAISYHAGVLKEYQQLLELIINYKSSNPYMQNLQERLMVGKLAASEIIGQLSAALAILEARQNAIFRLSVNLFFLLDIHATLNVLGWKQKYGSFLGEWLEVLSEWDALCCLAGFAYANPDYGFPELREKEKGFFYKSEELGHPLIPTEDRVCNNFDMASSSSSGQTVVITGSNMSGKSTFLRTLGINAVLAMAGAPVCAKSMAISSCRIFTSMRIQDSLSANTSAFYAELKRLRQLLEQVNSADKVPVFFLLDELLRGTNSQDRHLGVKAIIGQLNTSGASGLVSTHDLALAELAGQLPMQIRNMSFNSRIEGQKILFDYQLVAGVCHSFSASALMEQIGLTN